MSRLVGRGLVAVVALVVGAGVLVPGGAVASPVGASRAVGVVPGGAAAGVTAGSSVADPEQAALAKAMSTGTAVEVASLRDEYSHTMANPDGTLTLSMATAPQRGRAADGSWAGIDTTLVRYPDGSVGPRVAAVGVRFSGGGEGAGLVRVDREGVLLRDYHTAKSIKSAYVTHRYYLSDAAFLAGLEGEEAMLENIAAALRCPAFPLFLGRRSCPPEGKVLLGIRQGRSLEKALREEPWLAGERVGKREALPPTLRMVMDANSTQPGAYFTRDVPLSFDQTHRKFGFRRVTEHAAAPPILKAGAIPSVDPPTDHDPMQELEE